MSKQVADEQSPTVRPSRWGGREIRLTEPVGQVVTFTGPYMDLKPVGATSETGATVQFGTPSVHLTDASTEVPPSQAEDDMGSIVHATARETLERRVVDAAMRHWRATIESHVDIESHPWIRDGMPVIRGTRVPVSIVLGYLTFGPGMDQLMRDYPELNEDSIRAAVDFALSLVTR